MKSLLHPGRMKIIVPAHNCAGFITECLNSIREQDFTDYEVLIADDHSEDSTREKILPFLDDARFKAAFRTPRHYLMGNIAKTFKEIASDPNDVIAVVDGDDKLLPNAFSKIWEMHCQGYDFVYTDMEISDGTGSIGRPLIREIPIRLQNWCVSHLRSFKGYLLDFLDDELFKDDDGRFFRAAGDMSWIMPAIESAGMHKVCFIPQKLYFYRVHDNCNFKARRAEQLANNKLIRSRPPLPPQTGFFDFEIETATPSKSELRDLAREARKKIPLPYSIRIRYFSQGSGDSWQAYSGLWIGEGVYFEAIARDSTA